MKSPGSSKDRDFGHNLEDVECTPFINVVQRKDSETGIVPHELVDLLLDHADVFAEIVGGETKLDKLLLFHEDLVRTVVHDILAKDWSGQMLENA